MKRLLATLLSVVSFSALSQPTLMTELKADDNWLKANFSQLSSDYKINGATYVADLDSYGVDSLFVSSGEGSFIPFVGLGADRLSMNDENTFVKSAYAGGIFNIDDGRNAFILAAYNQSSDTDLLRSHANGSISFQMSEVGEKIKHELTLSGVYFMKAEEVRGGHSFTISNKSKVAIGSKLDVIFNLGTELSSELKLEKDSYRTYDSSYSYGIDVNIHPTKQFTLELSLENTSEKGKEEDQNISTDFNRDITVTSLSLLSRF